MNKLRAFEAFAGIGTQRMALKRLGINHKVIGISEIDKFAIKSYEAIHGETKNFGDIAQINTDDLPEFDLFTYSFPCQDISVAGHQKGLDKGSETRSSLLWECERIIKDCRPKYLLMENVKNLVGKKHIHNFEKWLEILEGYGYINSWRVLNAKDYGIPQNRERVFCVSILGEHTSYEFPKGFELKLRLKDILEDEVEEKFYLSKEQVDRIKFSNFNQEKKRLQEKEYSDTLCARDYKDPKVVRVGGIFDKENQTHQAGSIYDKEQLAPTIDTMQGGWRQPCVSIDLPAIAASRGRKNDNKYIQQLEFNQNGISNTLTTVEKDNYLVTSDTNKSIPIKNGTKKGYLEAHSGDGIELINPTCNNRRGRVQKDCSQTLTCNSGRGVVTDDFRIRKLTPLEFWRLMGIDDKDFYKARKVNSDSQLYKQAGNAIVVDVLAAIFMQLFNKK